MNIKWQFLRGRDHLPIHMFLKVFVIAYLTYDIYCFYKQMTICYTSLYSIPPVQLLFNNSLSQCRISYDDCRCSITSNRFHHSSDCITDIQAMTRGISPLFSFILQIYVTYHLFSIKGSYSHVLRDLLWFIALLVFVFISKNVYENSCLCLLLTLGIYLTGYLLFSLFTGFFLSYRNPDDLRDGTDRTSLSTKGNCDDEVSSVVIVV